MDIDVILSSEPPLPGVCPGSRRLLDNVKVTVFILEHPLSIATCGN